MTLVVYAVLAGIRLHNAMNMEQTTPNNASNNTHLKETGPAKSGEAAINSRSISFLQNTFSFHRRPANENFLVVGKVLAGCIGSAPYVQVATRVMSSMLYSNAQGCRIFVTNIKGYLGSMQLPCFNSCGKMIFVVLQYSSRSA